MATEPKPQPELVTDGLEDFLQLETKISKVVDALRTAREARSRAEHEVVELKTKHAELKQEFTQSERELVGLRKERDEIRRRLERVMQQLDSLAE